MQPEALEALSADIHLLGDLLGETIRRLAGPGGLRPGRGGPRGGQGAPGRPVGRGGAAAPRPPRPARPARAADADPGLQHLFRPDQPGRAAGPRPGPPGPPARGGRHAPWPRAPSAALRQLRDRGDRRRTQIAEHLGAGADLPGLHRPPERGPAADDPRRSSPRSPASSTGSSAATSSPPSATRAVAAIAEEVETLWLSDTIRGTRPTVLDEVRQGLERGRGEPARRRPSGLPDGRGGPARGLSRPRVAGPAVPPVRLLDRRRPRRAPRRLARRHGRGDPAPAGDPAPPLPRADRRPLAAAQPLRPLRSSRARTCCASLAKDAALFPELPASPEHEPYRAKCRLISAKLRRTLESLRSSSPAWAGDGPSRRRRASTSAGDELLDDLRLIADDLRRVGAQAAAAGAIQRRDPAGRGLRRPPADARPPPAQRPARRGARRDPPRRRRLPGLRRALARRAASTCLARELDETRPLIPTHLAYSAETNEVVQTFRTVAAILEQQCPEAIDTYIISSTTEPAHLLEVLLLAREARLFRPAEGISRLDIVPLFEALEPLQTASAIMEQLLAPADLPPPPGASRASCRR